MAGRELPEAQNYARWIWPAVIGGLVYGAAAARSQTKWSPLLFAGVGAYAVNKAMVNEKDFVSIKLGGSPDLLPF